MILGELTSREVMRRPGRALLTLLSIVIGVAAVVAVSLAITSTRGAYRDMYERLAGRAALEVVAGAGGAFDQSIAPTLQKIPGVRRAVPSVQQLTVLYWKENRFRLLALGIDPAEDTSVRDYDLAAGQFFVKGSGAILENNFANSLGIEVGDRVELMTRHGLQRATIVGLLAPRGVAGFAQGGVIFLPIEAAQYLFGRPGMIDNVSLVLDPSADEAKVAAEVAQRLPPGLSVRQPGSRARLAQETFLNVEQGLKFAGALTVVLAMIIILNTFLMNVGERRRQLSILRAVGATRSQIIRMLLGEGLAMGVAGTVLGTLAGVGGAHLLLGALAQLSATPPPPMEITYWPFLQAALIGPGTAVLGAYFPARFAGKISPLEGIRSAVTSDRAPLPRWVTITGVAAVVLGSSILMACIFGWLPVGLVVPSGIVFLVAFVLVVPSLLGPFAWAAAALIRPAAGIEADLARRQLARRRLRSGLTIGVLYVAVATGIGLGSTIVNNVQDVHDWYRRTMVGDFFVRAMFSSTTTGEAVAMPASFAADIRLLPGVASVDTLRFISGRADDHPVVIVVRDYRDSDFLPLDLTQGNPDDVRRQLFAGEVAVGTVLAQRLGLRVGDHITLETPQGPKALRIAGISVDYTVGGYTVFLQRDVADRLLHVEGVDAILIRAIPGHREQLEHRLQEFTHKHGLMLHSFAELSRLLDMVMTGVVRSLWGLLVLGFVVSAFGITNTLTMNVLEQTREIALLRVVAMTRAQVRQMILSQALIIGLIGLAIGTIAGVNTAYMMTLAVQPVLGYPVTFHLHPSLIASAIGLGLAFVLLAAWLPAERASRIDLMLALQYE
jgi:putative ABC transport system permease protein